MQPVGSARDAQYDKGRKLAAARPHAESNGLLRSILLAKHTNATTTVPALPSGKPEQQSSNNARIILDYVRRAMEPDALGFGSLHVDGNGIASAKISIKGSYLMHCARKIPVDTRKDELRRDHYHRNSRKEFTALDPRLYPPMHLLECLEWNYRVAGNTKELTWGDYEGLMVACKLSLVTRKKVGTFVERVWGGTVGPGEVAAVAKMALEYSLPRGMGQWRFSSVVA